MRITEIRVHCHEIRVDGGRYQMAISAVASLDSTVVEIVTDVGLHGFGETTPLGPTYQPQHALGARAAIAQMAPAMLGVDPRRLELVRRAMDGALNGHNYAKTAIDVACWDLRGKAYDERICDLLGGTDQSSVPSYFGVMPDTAAATADMARAKQDAGYRRLQVKVGGRPLAEDIEATRAVAAVIDPDTRLLVDANRGWTGRDTIEFSTACRDVRLSIENPCRTYDEHRAVASKLHHPLFLDECSTDIGAVSKSSLVLLLVLVESPARAARLRQSAPTHPAAMKPVVTESSVGTFAASAPFTTCATMEATRPTLVSTPSAVARTSVSNSSAERASRALQPAGRSTGVPVTGSRAGDARAGDAATNARSSPSAAERTPDDRRGRSR